MSGLSIMAIGCINQLEKELVELCEVKHHVGLIGDVDAKTLSTDELYRLTMLNLYKTCISKLEEKIKDI